LVLLYVAVVYVGFAVAALLSLYVSEQVLLSSHHLLLLLFNFICIILQLAPVVQLYLPDIFFV